MKAQRYVTGYVDMWQFFDTFAYNFGLIYDSIVNTINDLITRAANPNVQTSDMYLMLGYGLGNIFYLIFYTA